MRRTLMVGCALAVAAAVVVLLGSVLHLQLESAALLGAAMGGVVALVPHGSPWWRLGGFALGFVLAWVGYVIRAAQLPDTTQGRAVAAAVVVLLCTIAAGASRERFALWATLLGAGAFAGAYEFTYNQAPQQIASTSVSTATTMLFNVAIGFLVASLLSPIERTEWPGPTDDAAAPDPAPKSSQSRPVTRTDADTVALDSMLEADK